MSMQHSHHAPPAAWRLFGAFLLVLAAQSGASLTAADAKITYNDNIRPIFESNCSSCHKPGKQKAGLNLLVYRGVLKGSSSGKVVETGNAASVLMKCITHSADPFMPPEGAKLKDDEIALIRQWILGGLLESKDGAPVEVVANAALAMSAPSVKPGAVTLPHYLNLNPFLETHCANPVTALAASPTSPLVAVGGYKQVLFYQTSQLDLVGVLPFPEGQIYDVKFSQDGSMVLASGGVNGKSGSVCLWDVKTGKRLFKLENDFDSTLAADVSSDRKWFATGGSDRFVKIYSAKDGSQLFNIKQHSEWITNVAFSPDAKLLATGDRNGHIHVWESASGQKHCTLTHHQAAITGLSWRADSHLLASCAADGEVVVWDMSQGTVAKSFMAHQGGATDVSYANDGTLMTCGRDHCVRVYDTNLSEIKHMDKMDQIALRAVATPDSAQAISADFQGALYLWKLADQSLICKVSSNPPSLTQRIADVDKAIAETDHQIHDLESATDEGKRKECAALREKAAHLALEKQRWQAESINADRYSMRDAIADLEKEAAGIAGRIAAKGGTDELAKRQVEITGKLVKLRDQEKERYSSYVRQLPEDWKAKD